MKTRGEAASYKRPWPCGRRFAVMPCATGIGIPRLARRACGSNTRPFHLGRFLSPKNPECEIRDPYTSAGLSYLVPSKPPSPFGIGSCVRKIGEEEANGRERQT